MPKCLGGITWPEHTHAQSQFGAVKTDLRHPCYSFRLYTRAALAWRKKKRSLRNEKLKANRASETEEQRKERLRIRRENKKTENHEKQSLTNSQKIERGYENELERNLRLEKVVASKQLSLVVETEEERRGRLENDAATKRLRFALFHLNYVELSVWLVVVDEIWVGTGRNPDAYVIRGAGRGEVWSMWFCPSNPF